MQLRNINKLDGFDKKSNRKKLIRNIITLLAFLLPFGFAIAIYRECNYGIPVLNYHQVNDEDVNLLTVPTETFAQQMQYLADEGYVTISPDQLYEYITTGAPLPEKPILITFDDGYEDNFRNAYPILKEHGMQATIFLITDFVGQFDNYLNWSEIVEMSEYGIYFGSHTLDHEELIPPMPPEEIYRQLYNSKLVIEWRTLHWCEFVAFPCGSFDDVTLEQATKAGFKGGFTVRYDLAREGDNPFDINRVPVFGHAGSQYDMMRFKLRLKFAPVFGTLERIQERLRNAGYNWLADRIFTP